MEEILKGLYEMTRYEIIVRTLYYLRVYGLIDEMEYERIRSRL